MASNQAVTGEENTTSLGFRPAPNPWMDEGSTVATLHGLTHDQVCEITGGAKVNLSDRYIAIAGPAGSLSGYVKSENFEAICRLLGVQS